jgi:hypothetical protein
LVMAIRRTQILHAAARILHGFLCVLCGGQRSARAPK